MDDLTQAKETAHTLGVDAQRSLTLIGQFDLRKQADLEFVVSAAAEVKDKINEVDGKRKEFVDPLNKVVKSINAFFKPALDGLKECESTIKSKIVDYVNYQEEQRDETLHKVKSVKTEAARTALIAEADAHVVDKVDGMQIRGSWEGEIVDASLLPREYLMPDLKALKAMTKAKGGDPQIPGWKAWPNCTVAITVDKVKR